MTTGGWAFLVVVWGILIVVTAWCFSKILESPAENKNPDPGGAHRL